MMKKYRFDYSPKTRPFPHQVEAIEYISNRQAVPLFDEQGLGKTKIVMLAMTFIGLPFVVRTLQPILEDLDPEIEQAAASLGATRRQTIARVILPELWPAILTGFALAFARALGEYGSVVFISGNMPMRTEIAPLLIIIKLEQYDSAGAAAIAVVMLAASFSILLLINLLQRWKSTPQAAV